MFIRSSLNNFLQQHFQTIVKLEVKKYISNVLQPLE